MLSTIRIIEKEKDRQIEKERGREGRRGKKKKKNRS